MTRGVYWEPGVGSATSVVFCDPATVAGSFRLYSPPFLRPDGPLRPEGRAYYPGVGLARSYSPLPYGRSGTRRSPERRKGGPPSIMRTPRREGPGGGWKDEGMCMPGPHAVLPGGRPPAHPVKKGRAVDASRGKEVAPKYPPPPLFKPLPKRVRIRSYRRPGASFPVSHQHPARALALAPHVPAGPRSQNI